MGKNNNKQQKETLNKKKTTNCILLSGDEKERSVEKGHSNDINMQNTFYINTSVFFFK